MLGQRLPKARRFEYQPLYYDPRKDEEEKHRITFRRRTPHPALRSKSPLGLIMVLALLFYIFLHFLKLAR